MVMCDPAVLCISCQGELAAAGALYERCQAIDEKVLGPEHPSLATTLSNRAVLLEAQVRAGGVVKRNVCFAHGGGCSAQVPGILLLGSADESRQMCGGNVMSFGRLTVWRTRSSGVVDEMCPRCSAVDPTLAEMWFCLAMNSCLSVEARRDWPCV